MSEKTSPPRSLIRLAAAALVAAALALAAPATAASAHDELLGADPSPDATVAELPASITLTFSGILLDEPGATEIAVTDAGGASLVSGDPVLDGTRVTQELDGAASGAVTVLWKVVSSDGHPVSGEYAFTVGSGDAPAPDASAQQPAEGDDAAAGDADAAASETQPSTTAWVVLLVVGMAVLLAILYLVVSRARRERDH